MEHEVHVVDRPALRVAAKRVSVAIETIGPTLAQSFNEVYGAIAAAGAEAAGPPFVIYHSMPSPGQPLVIEICAPVSGPFEPREPWRLLVLPAGTFVSQMHVGPYDTVGETYTTLSEWVPAHGLAIAGPPREVYLSDPATPPDQIQTIIEYPVLRAPVGVG